MCYVRGTTVWFWFVKERFTLGTCLSYVSPSLGVSTVVFADVMICSALSMCTDNL